MAAIKGTEGLTVDQIRDEISRGAKFVYFTYCISIVVMTFRRPSSIYFVKSGGSSFKYGWPYMIASLVFGWWGIPWGPIYTLQAAGRSFSGKDITSDVMSDIERQHSIDNPITSWDNFNQQQN